MSYTEYNQYNSPNYTPGHLANSVWGQGARKVSSITIHWWGDPNNNPKFLDTVNYLCRAGGNTSAHVIVEAGKVAWIVDGNNSAWHAGNAVGNSHSIGIECNPRAWDGDYQTIGELVRDIRKVYGDLPLIPHNYWQSTQCPGVYDLGRIDAIARNGSSAPAPAPVPAPAQPPTVVGGGIHNILVTNDVAWVRTAPRASAPLAPGFPQGIAKGATIAARGYVKGDDPFNDGVQDDAWIRTRSDFYIWANALNNNKLDGLPYLGDMSSKPAPAPAPAPKPAAKPAPQPVLHNRTVTNAVAYVRTEPRSNAPMVAGYPNGIAQGAVLAVKGYVSGQDPYGTGDDAWYVTKSGYVWANAAQNTLAGLSKLN